MPSTRPFTLALAVALAAGAAQADEITDQLDAARGAYESGDLRGAVDTLNFAVASIQEKITQGLLKLLPEPIAGWQAEPAQSESGGLASMITGTTLSRRYFRDDGGEVTLRLMANSPMLPMLTMFLSSPFMMQADPATKPYSVKGQRGMIKQESDGSVEATLMVGNTILVQAEGSGSAGQEAVRAYLEALDLDAIARAFGPAAPGVPL
jgi:hypothetical protein